MSSNCWEEQNASQLFPMGLHDHMESIGSHLTVVGGRIKIASRRASIDQHGGQVELPFYCCCIESPWLPMGASIDYMESIGWESPYYC